MRYAASSFFSHTREQVPLTHSLLHAAILLHFHGAPSVTDYTSGYHFRQPAYRTRRMAVVEGRPSPASRPSSQSGGAGRSSFSTHAIFTGLRLCVVVSAFMRCSRPLVLLSDTIATGNARVFHVCVVRVNHLNTVYENFSSLKL